MNLRCQRGFQEFDWYKLFTALDMQETNNKYVGASRFVKEVLANNRENIDAFQFAIDNNIILRYTVIDTKDPVRQIIAIRLNRVHPLVIQYMGKTK
jgi:hypothetical protein